MSWYPAFHVVLGKLGPNTRPRSNHASAFPPNEPPADPPAETAQDVRDGAGPQSVSDPGGGQAFADMPELVTKVNASASNSIFVATASSYTLSGLLDWADNKHPRIYCPGLPAAHVFEGGGGNNLIGPNIPGGWEWYGGLFQNVGNASSPTWTAAMVFDGGDSVVQDVEFANCFVGVNYGLDAGQTGTPTYRRLYVHDSLFTNVLISASSNTVQSPVVEYCEFANGNTAGFNPGGTAGGTKFLQIANGIWDSNWIHDNGGFGLWLDATSSGNILRTNVCENNVHSGIFYEISSGGRIHNNWLYNNGFGDLTLPDGAPTTFNSWNLLMSSNDLTLGSGTLEIDHNLIDSTQPGSDPDAGRLLGFLEHDTHGTNNEGVFDVHDNQFWVRGTREVVGGQDWGATKTLWTVPDVRFRLNEYHVTSLSNINWRWGTGSEAGSGKSWSQWQALGFDTDSTRAVI